MSSCAVTIGALSTQESLKALYFLHIAACFLHAHFISGWAVGLAGSDALYHAKLDWIKLKMD